MVSKRIITSNFEIYDKLSKLDLTGRADFFNTPQIQASLHKIINNINSREALIEAQILGDRIVIYKKRNFNCNIYYKN